jgi:hydrogenase maturation protease
MKKTVVLGAGNELMKDEGVGVHTIRALRAELPRLNTDVELIDSGTSTDLSYLAHGVDTLIIIDAVKGGCEPGTIYRFNADHLVSDTGVATSLHQVGIIESLRMMELTGGKPIQTVVIGIEPAEVDIGLELSQEIQTLMPKIIQTVLEEINPNYSANEIMNETRV